MINSADTRRSDCMLLAALVAGIYLRALGHMFQASWDDNWYVLYNESIRGFSWHNIRTVFSSIYQANYAPLQMISYMADYTLWGYSAPGFVATNIILHAINGILLYRLLLNLHGERLFALVGAAFFLVHPLQVESVAWISCRKNVLSLLFFLLSWEWYRRYREAEEGNGNVPYWASVAAFLLSLMAKSTTLVLPLILLVFDRCFPTRVGRRPSLMDKIPYLAAALLFAAISMWFQQTEFQGGIRTPYHGGSPFATLLTMLPVFCTYLARLVWPAGLSAVYAPAIHVTIDASVVVAAVALAAVAWGGIRLFRGDRRLGFWFAFFWLGLLPFAQIVPIEWLITDRYMNLSIIGPAALAGAGAVWLRGRVVLNRRRYLYGLLAVCIAALAVASFVRVGYWRDPLTLWRDAAEKTPGSDKAWEQLGELLNDAGQIEQARHAYERGLTIDPNSVGILFGLGYLLTNSGELDKGKALLDKLLDLRPDYATGWGSLGWNYQLRGDVEAAVKAYQRSLELQPEAWPVLLQLGNLERGRGNLPASRRYYDEVETRTGGKPESAYGLACLEARGKKPEAALRWLETALQRGYGDCDSVNDDPELSSLRNDPRFNYLMVRYFPADDGEKKPGR